MVSLLDLGPLREKVELRGKELEVRGLSADFIFQLLTTSDELRLLIAQRKVDPDNVAQLINQAPVAIAKCITFATGSHGDSAAFAFALTELGPGETLDLIRPIWRLTFPKGVKSFMDGLADLAREATGGDGWAAVMKSQERSAASSEPATVPEKPGDTPQGS